MLKEIPGYVSPLKLITIKSPFPEKLYEICQAQMIFIVHIVYLLKERRGKNKNLFMKRRANLFIRIREIIFD